MNEWFWPLVSAGLAVMLIASWLRRKGEKDDEPRRASDASDAKDAPRDSAAGKAPASKAAAKKTSKTSKAAKPAKADGADATTTSTVTTKSAKPPAEAKTDAKTDAKADAKAETSAKGELPKLDYEEDSDVDPTKIGQAAAAAHRPKLQPPAKKIVYDEDAAVEEPTHARALILLSATAQTDKGVRRKRNEDSLLTLPDHGVYVVADGMGGYSGGEIASALAVKTIETAFREGRFEGEPHDSIPPRASELARAIQMANDAILERAGTEKLEGMGTTICAVRFSPNKQRLYVGHVGDSRIYRLRDGTLRQMTSDHTMRDHGVTGAAADHLSRAVGIWPTVPIDIVLGEPKPDDVYIMCSDGLSKMVPDSIIAEIANAQRDPAALVHELITKANERGGRDNITVIVIRVVAPTLAAATEGASASGDATT